MGKKDDILFEGTVIRIEKTYFVVQLHNVSALSDKEFRCKLSGKMRMHKIRVIIGDRVTVKIDPYNIGTGTITYRTK